MAALNIEVHILKPELIRSYISLNARPFVTHKQVSSLSTQAEFSPSGAEKHPTNNPKTSKLMTFFQQCQCCNNFCSAMITFLYLFARRKVGFLNGVYIYFDISANMSCVYTHNISDLV